MALATVPCSQEKIGVAARMWPLAWPTVSLGLAFASGPGVVAINVPLMLWNVVPIARRMWKVLIRERRLNVDFLDVLAIGVSDVPGRIRSLPGSSCGWCGWATGFAT